MEAHAQEPRTLLGLSIGEVILILSVVIAIGAAIALFATAALGDTRQSRTSLDAESEREAAPWPAASHETGSVATHRAGSPERY